MDEENILKSNKPSEKDLERIREADEEAKQPEPPEEPEPEEETDEPEEMQTQIFAIRTTANREDQVVDFLASNVKQKGFRIYSIIRPHGMRGYIFIEGETRQEAEEAIKGIPYAKGVLPKEVGFDEIEHMLEQTQQEVDIRKNDIAEIISGPFKRQKCKIVRADKSKSEVVVELLEAAVPIPITLSMDSVKVIRRD